MQAVPHAHGTLNTATQVTGSSCMGLTEALMGAVSQRPREGICDECSTDVVRAACCVVLLAV